MFGVMPAIISAAAGAGGGVPFPVTDQLLGQWDPALGVTGTAPMTTWADQSGNGNDWLEDTGSGGEGPTLSSAVLNGLDVVTFDGTNDKMSQAAFISGATDGTLACVVRRTTTSNKGWCVFGSSSTQPHFMHGNLIYETFGSSVRASGIASSAFDLNEWGVYLVTMVGNQMTRYANDSQFATQSLTKSWYTTFRLGSGNLGGAIGSTSGFQGQIADMAVWDKGLVPAEQTSVFDHWNDKFALGL